MPRPLCAYRRMAELCRHSGGSPAPALGRSGVPRPLLAPARSLRSRPARVVGASGHRCSLRSRVFIGYAQWGFKGAWGLAAPAFSLASVLGVRSGLFYRSGRTPNTFASLPAAFSLRSPAAPFSPHLLRHHQRISINLNLFDRSTPLGRCVEKPKIY